MIVALIVVCAVPASALAAGSLNPVALPSSSTYAGWEAVNASDQVAGTYEYSGSTHPTAVRWQHGTLTALQIPSNALMGTPNANAPAIDAAGGLFGGYSGADDADLSRAYPVVWSPSLVPSAPATGQYDGTNSSSISPAQTAASANGNTAGWWCGNNGTRYTPCAYYYALAPSGSQTAYQFVSLSTPAATVDGRIAINDAGALAIGYGSQSYLYPNGPTGPMVAATIQLAGTPRDINDAGDVIGESGGMPAIELADGTVETLPLLRSGDTARPTAINDDDEVVGNECLSTTCTPVAWIDGKVTALTSMVPESFKGTLGSPVDVNNKGSILVSSPSNTGTSYLLESRPKYKVSGTVYGQHCTSTCRLSGLADQTILVQGKASDGTAVNESSVTKASGAWSVMVPSGQYVAGSTLNGSTIDPTGYDPGSQPVTVGSGPVSDVDFTTCATREETSADLMFAPAGRLSWLRSMAVPRPNPLECNATYSFAVSANVPQPTFVDPSPNAPHAKSDAGTGYPANNDVFGNQWQDTLPDCKDFSGRTYETTPLEWLSYYRGNTSLGSATIDLHYHSSLTFGTTLSNVSYDPGSLTRVFEFKRGDGKTGHCDSPRRVLPQVSTKINENSFTIVVSWSIPFTPRGVPLTEKEVLQLRGVAKSVHKLADDALDEVPGFKEQDKKTKALATYALAETIEHGYLHVGKKLPSLKDAVSLGEDLLTYEKRLNLGLLIAQYGWEYAAAQFEAKLGYNPMVMVIRGQIRRIPCPGPGKPKKICDLTQLAYDTTTARFPDYHLSVKRNGKPLPAAPDVPNRIHVVDGNQVQRIPNLNNSLEEFPGSKGGGLDERDLHDKGMGKLGPSAFEFESGAPLVGPEGPMGIPEELPGCNDHYNPTSTHTRCYTFGDGFA